MFLKQGDLQVHGPVRLCEASEVDGSDAPAGQVALATTITDPPLEKGAKTRQRDSRRSQSVAERHETRQGRWRWVIATLTAMRAFDVTEGQQLPLLHNLPLHLLEG